MTPLDIACLIFIGLSVLVTLAGLKEVQINDPE
jgi:hypothetical protein